MNKFFKIILLILFLSFVSCTQFKKAIGFDKNPPNEFMIKKVKPITLPPTYDLPIPDSKNNVSNVNVKKEEKIQILFDESLNKKKISEEIESSEIGVSNTEDEILKKLGN